MSLYASLPQTALRTPDWLSQPILLIPVDSFILYNTNEFECISKDNTVRVFKNEITLDELRKSGETSKFNADDVIMIES